MSERTEAELRRILASAVTTVTEAADRARTEARAPVVELTADPAASPEATADDPGEGDLVACCVLWDERWRRSDLDRLHDLIDAADGARRLLIVEPVPALGMARLLQRLGRRRLRRRLGHDFERDLPRELRQVGFQVYLIDRFRTDRFGLRTYAYVVLGPRRDGRRAPA